MSMQEYSKNSCKEPYHPDDTPNFFLSKNTIEKILKNLNSMCVSDKDQDTLAFIRFHENLQRELAKGRIAPVQQKQLIETRAEAFRKKHGDWVHHANALYWKFYESV